MELAEKKFNILYVDDEETNLRIFKISFRKDYNVFTADNGDEAIQVMKEQEIDLIITDQQMPQMSGVDLLKKIIPNYPKTLRMIMTGFTDSNALIEAVNEIGINKYIKKPWSRDVLKETLDFELEQYLELKGISGATDKEDQHIEIKETIDFVQKSFLKNEEEIRTTFKDSFFIKSGYKSAGEVYWTGEINHHKVFCKIALRNSNNFAGILLNGLYATICNTILSWQEKEVNATTVWDELNKSVHNLDYLGFASKMLSDDIEITCLVQSENNVSFKSNQTFAHALYKSGSLEVLRDTKDLKSIEDIKEIYIYSHNLIDLDVQNTLMTAKENPQISHPQIFSQMIESLLHINAIKEGSNFFAIKL